MDEQMTDTGRPAIPAEVWEAVKADYLAGLSGPDCCRRHGVTLSGLRDRAARQGWRRSDQPWTSPNVLDPWDEGLALEARVGGNLDLIEWRDLSQVAEGRMMKAVLRGDAVDFMRWNKVAEILDARETELRRWTEDDAARQLSRREMAGETAADAAEADSADAAEPDSRDYPDSRFHQDLEDQAPIAASKTPRDRRLVRPESAQSLSPPSRERSGTGDANGAQQREPVTDPPASGPVLDHGSFGAAESPGLAGP